MFRVKMRTYTRLKYDIVLMRAFTRVSIGAKRENIAVSLPLSRCDFGFGCERKHRHLLSWHFSTKPYSFVQFQCYLIWTKHDFKQSRQQNRDCTALLKTMLWHQRDITVAKCTDAVACATRRLTKSATISLSDSFDNPRFIARFAGVLVEPLPAVFGSRRGYTLDRLPGHA